MHSPATIDRVLIANRGEIARRIIRTCHRLGIGTVAVYSDADADAPFVREADGAIRLPGNAAVDTYLRADLLFDAARRSGANAVHPGYGFLSESATFAQAVVDAGLIFIGPPSSAIAAMGSKIEAKRLMRAAEVPVLADNTVESLADVGLPALVKASAGGGGRGMRIVHTAESLADAIASAQHEALAAFGDGTVFVERYVEGARHVEIQIFADAHGNTISLFERDCTLQRRHQKIVEESPSPAVDPVLRQRMGAAAIAAAESVGYVGAGTVEFLLDRDGDFFFLEMNTRLQVEHPVTEMVTGLDLVELQLIVAAGEPLPDAALRAGHSGHAIEVRLCAEDPYHGYMPSSGRFERVEFPVIDGVRIDSGIESGSVVSPFYDSMIAKVIAHAPTRHAAARRIVATLSQATLVGPVTNREQLIELMGRLEAIDEVVDTGWLDRSPPTALPAPDATTIAMAAIAVAEQQAAARTVLAGLPAGWRNNSSQPFEQRLVRPDGTEHVVHHRRDRMGHIIEVVVDGQPADGQAAADLARLRPPVFADDLVHLDGGRSVFRVPPRFTPPDDAGRAGSLVAPMPGAVLRVLVAVGDVVHPGQPLIAIEAMKMEHQVVAPGAGTVAEVFVHAGEQLDTGQVLVRIEAHDTGPTQAEDDAGSIGDNIEGQE